MRNLRQKVTRYRAIFYQESGSTKLTCIDQWGLNDIMSHATKILENDYHDALCVIEEYDTQTEVIKLKRCSID
jgi:hypothetical protein